MFQQASSSKPSFQPALPHVWNARILNATGRLAQEVTKEMKIRVLSKMMWTELKEVRWHNHSVFGIDNSKERYVLVRKHHKHCYFGATNLQIKLLNTIAEDSNVNYSKPNTSRALLL